METGANIVRKDMCGDHAEARRMMESDVYDHRGRPDLEVVELKNAVKSRLSSLR